MEDTVRFTLVIRCENDGSEQVLSSVEATSPQGALDMMMGDLRQVVKDYDKNPDINSPE